MSQSDLPKSSSPSRDWIGHGIVETRYYSFIDGLRGLAVLMVLAIHTYLYGEPLREEALRSLISNGVKGVQLFFILSAFTLLSTSLQRFPHEQHPRRNFYIRRAFRILPLWWLAIAVYAFAWMHYGIRFDSLNPSATELLLDASFLFGFTPTHMHPIVAGGWSLFIEESFYWFLPLLVGYVTDIDGAARLTLGLVGISVAWNPVSRLLLHGNPLWSTFYFYFPLCQWFIFGFGFVLYFAIRDLARQVLSTPLMRLLDLMTAVGLWATFVSKPIGPDFYAATGALTLLCFCASQANSLWAKVLDVAPLRAFGQCCFSIYLFHGLLLRAVEPWREPFLRTIGLAEAHPGLRFVTWFLLMAAASLIGGQLSFRLFEKPLVRLGHRVIGLLDTGATTPPVGNLGRAG